MTCGRKLQKLWKLLIDKKMNKNKLERETEITRYALGKRSQGKGVSTETSRKSVRH